jgi:hypothetical protein
MWRAADKTVAQVERIVPNEEIRKNPLATSLIGVDAVVRAPYGSHPFAGPGYYVEDPNRDGILAGDRKHVLKLFGSYQIIRNATLGGYLRIQSGQPYEARGFGDYAGSNLYIEKAGSRRTPTWTNFDLLASYAVPIQIVTVRLEGRVLNVFNSQPALTVDNRQLLVGQVVNPNFETPTSFATPRRFSLTAVISF